MQCMYVRTYIVNVCTYAYACANTHICATDIPRTFSRPVSSFVTLPSPFSDFLSSASAIRFFPGRGRYPPGGTARAKNREESESFSRILNASNVIHGQLSSRAGERYSLARKIFSCEKKSVFGDTY